MKQYIDAKTFADFNQNQNRLIEILNHNMTRMDKTISNVQTDVSWVKKILWAIFSVAIASFVAIFVNSIFKF